MLLFLLIFASTGNLLLLKTGHAVNSHGRLFSVQSVFARSTTLNRGIPLRCFFFPLRILNKNNRLNTLPEGVWELFSQVRWSPC